MHKLRLVVSLFMFFVVGWTNPQWFFGSKVSLPTLPKNQINVIENKLPALDKNYKNLIQPTNSIPRYLWRTFQNSVINTTENPATRSS